MEKKAPLTPEEISANWEKFRALCEKKLGERSPSVLNMIDSLGERLALCPASSKRDFHNAFPGGLVDHSLRVLGNAMRLCSAQNWSVPRDSLIIGCLFHDLGKVGDEKTDLYLPQKDMYRLERFGEEYAYNNDMIYMTVPDRGLYLCNYFGVKLTASEFLAIKLNDGQYAPENASYKLKEPMLADIVHISDLISTKQEKGLLP